MKENSKKYDFFNDGMRIFLDYISRQSKRNPEYRPHTLIRAFECAISALDNIDYGETCMGMSQDGEENLIYNPYVVVLKKRKDGIEILSIQNLKVKKEMPIDFIIYIFRIQIHLDKIKGDYINSLQMAEILNKVIPGNIFYALGERWKEARDNFFELLKHGNISLPPDPKFFDAIRRIKKDTPWEEYPNFLRSYIGSSFATKIKSKGKVVVISSPANLPIEKYKVFDIVTEFFLGKASEYFLEFFK